MYEVGLIKSFTAWHVMPGMEGPEGTLHSHDYRLEVVVAREALDARGMVCDLDVVEAALVKMIGEIADENLDKIKPSHAEAVTVEVLARWAHGYIADALGLTSGMMSVRAWESPEAFGGYAAPLPSNSE